MERGNVLVIGNSGVGKSTLINSVLGEEKAETGWGTKGTTKELTIYDSEKIPFRIIDSVGFEPSFFKELRAINAVKKWSKDSAREGHENNLINVIWFCVEGTSRKLFPKTIDDLSKATKMWANVPVIVVITKSYSMPEREQNIEMVNNAFARQKRYVKNLRKVIPVVASTYVLNENAYAVPEGITELIDITNELMPEGIRAGELDLSAFKLSRKRALAHGLVGVSTSGAVVVGAVSIPFSDAALLAPLEVTMVSGLAKIYNIRSNDESKRFFQTIVEVGTVSIIAKSAIDALKFIPGINLGASVVNAIIAGSIVTTLGEGTIYVFEQVYLGNKSVADIEWVKKVIEAKFSTQFLEAAKSAIGKIADNVEDKDIAKIALEVIKDVFESRETKSV